MGVAIVIYMLHMPLCDIGLFLRDFSVQYLNVPRIHFLMAVWSLCILANSFIFDASFLLTCRYLLLVINIASKCGCGSH